MMGNSSSVLNEKFHEKTSRKVLSVRLFTFIATDAIYTACVGDVKQLLDTSYEAHLPPPSPHFNQRGLLYKKFRVFVRTFDPKRGIKVLFWGEVRCFFTP